MFRHINMSGEPEFVWVPHPLFYWSFKEVAITVTDTGSPTAKLMLSKSLSLPSQSLIFVISKGC